MYTRRNILIIGGLVCLLALIVGGYFFLPAESDKDTDAPRDSTVTEVTPGLLTAGVSNFQEGAIKPSSDLESGALRQTEDTQIDVDVTEPGLSSAPEVSVPDEITPSVTADEEPVLAEVTTSQPETKETSVINCEAVRTQNFFFIDDTSLVVKREQQLVDSGATQAASLLQRIACYPQAVWLMGADGTESAQRIVSTAQAKAIAKEQMPVYVLYNHPLWNSLWWGSNLSETDYLLWVEAIAQTIGDNHAWVVIEPDALPMARSYSSEDLHSRTVQIKKAVEIFAAYPHISIYIDIGHSSWISVDDAVDLLVRSGVDKARGFSLNVSNYRHSADEVRYGNTIAARIPGSHFIVDTSRNGIGPHEAEIWCNAPNRALGQPPRRFTEHKTLDAYLWVKPPGESDGTCNNGPEAGKFWLEYALDLVHNRP